MGADVVFGNNNADFIYEAQVSAELLVVWMALSVLWVVLWLTVTNVMTGYVAINNAMVKLQDNTTYANFADIATLSNFGFQYFNFGITTTALAAFGHTTCIVPIISIASTNLIENTRTTTPRSHPAQRWGSMGS